jgi:uncharacterized protein (DUF885 family)
MHSRRHLLLSAGALAILGGCASKAAAPAFAAPPPAPAPDAAAQLSAFLEKIFDQALDDSPQLVTGLGLDKGERAQAKFKLDDSSLAEKARAKALNTAQLAELKAIDRAQLSGMPGVNYDSVLFNLETAEAANQRFDYGYLGAGVPYMISQLSGSYQSTPDWLDNQHRIETKEDADAYLSRLADFGAIIDQEVERARKDIGAGVIPPDFIIARALPQMQGMLVAPEASGLVTSVARRAKDKGIAGDYAGQAAKIYAEKVAPALERQVALFKETQGKAWHDAGVWRQPDGEAYYEQALHGSTTTRLSAEEVHNIGLEQAKALQSRADVLLRGEGLTKGSVGERDPGALQGQALPLSEHRSGQGKADRRPDGDGRGDHQAPSPSTSMRCPRRRFRSSGCPRRSRRPLPAATTISPASMARGRASTGSTCATRRSIRSGRCRP